MSEPKNILVIAQSKQIEALRMATGLTLLDDVVCVAVVGEMPSGPQAAEQLESLEFAEVPVMHLAEDGSAERNAVLEAVAGADVVYVV